MNEIDKAVFTGSVYTYSEVALGFLRSPTRVRQWVAEGKGGPSVPRANGARLFSEDDVQELAANTGLAFRRERPGDGR